MKKTKLRLLLLLFFIGGLIILPQKANADEVEAVPVSISVKYGQTEARTILDMINEARTNSEHAWYWNKDDTTKTFCTDLKELEYDYDLERVAMKRAAEIALSYDRQGHRRNMLSSKFNCVGIGHVYYNGVHYWVEEFAYRPEINTTEVPANDSTQAVSVSVDKTKIKKVDVTFDQDAYSLRIGENTTPVIKETRIGVEYFWSTVLTATLYGVTSSTSPPVSVHDCKNHWDTGSITKKPTCTEPGEKTFVCSICESTKKESVPATGHAYASTWTTDIAAACEKAGTESRHCTNENCTATTEQRSIAALERV